MLIIHTVLITNLMSQIYLISPPSIELESFKAQLKQAFDSGVVASFQLRLKNVPDSEILKAGEALIPLCREYDIPFILNDRVDLATQLKADGVHLGEEDEGKVKGKVTRARKVIGDDAVIGVSCYDSRDFAIIAADEGADYVSFGAFFPTKIKQAKAQPSPDILKWWSEWTVVPCVAIGGITAENAKILVDNGADFLAVISYVWEHPQGPGAALATLAAAVA